MAPIFKSFVLALMLGTCVACDNTQAPGPASTPEATQAQTPTVPTLDPATYDLILTSPDGLDFKAVENGLTVLPGANGEIMISGSVAELGFPGSVLAKAANLDLGTELEVLASGKHVTVDLVSSGGPFVISYSTNDSGNSGWREMANSPEAMVQGFEYDVPPMQSGGSDYLGIVPTSDTPVSIYAIGFKLDPSGS